jgi:hypothetical protein
LLVEFYPKRSKRTQTVDTDTLTWRQVHHLALQREIIALLGSAHNAFPRWTHHLDAEVIELKGFIHGKRLNIEDLKEAVEPLFMDTIASARIDRRPGVSVASVFQKIRLESLHLPIFFPPYFSPR